MTNTYTAVISGNFPPNTDNLAIEITAPANQTIKIKKIRITDADGTATTVNDFHRRVKLVTESVAGGGTSFTPITLDGNAPASNSTVTTGPTAVGTVATTIDCLSIHSATDFFWQAADEDDKIVLTPGQIFGIVVNTAN